MGDRPRIDAAVHRRWFAAAYVAQALAVVGWWALLFAGDPVRGWFSSEAGWDRANDYLWVDLAVVVVPSIVVAVALMRSWCSVRSWVIVTEIGVAFGLVEAVRWIGEPIDRWLGAVAMAAMLVTNDAARRALT